MTSNSLLNGHVAATDWLSDWSARHAADTADIDHERDELLGQLVFLASWLERADQLPPMPAAYWAALAEPCTRFPHQLHTIDHDTPVAQWLLAAALAEFLGEGALGWIMISALMPLVQHDTEVLAICHNRRGRIARLSGQLDDAELHYRDALRLADTHPARDAWPMAMIGLINVAIDRGNFPAAERQVRRMLVPDAGVLPVYRVGAWLSLSLVRRKRGDFLDAMLSAWNAYDLLPDGSPQRTEMVISLAECALALGDLPAAAQGFALAHRDAQSWRIRVSAATGLTQSRLPAAHDAAGRAALRDACTHLHNALKANLAPQERVLALLTYTDAMALLNDMTAARASLQEARALADAHAYHEYQFRVDALTAQLDAPDAPSSLPTPLTASGAASLTPSRAQTARPAVLQRLVEYAGV